jgi:hypothetical protein
MGYHLSGWRPMPFEPSERALLREYYQRAIQSFFKRMNQAGSDSRRLMANLWSVQAILKLIFIASPSLLDKHYDFYSALHDQNPGTVQVHCQIWETMAIEDGWTFA